MPPTTRPCMALSPTGSQLCKSEGRSCFSSSHSQPNTIYPRKSINFTFYPSELSFIVSRTQPRTHHSLPAWVTQSFDHQRFWREPAMTSSRTVLIEPSCLFRQGLKHLLADTRFAVEVEFSTIEQAVGDTVASGLVIIGKASTEPGD